MSSIELKKNSNYFNELQLRKKIVFFLPKIALKIESFNVTLCFRIIMHNWNNP